MAADTVRSILSLLMTPRMVLLTHWRVTSMERASSACLIPLLTNFALIVCGFIW